MKKIIIPLVAAFVLSACFQSTTRLQTPSNQTSTQGKGTVYFGVTDAAASMENVTAVSLSVSKAEVHSAAEGWITLSTDVKNYELLQLKQSGKVSLYSQTDVAAGTYDQVRLTVDAVTVTNAGTTSAAKLPSGELKVVGGLTVTADNKSSVVFDFLVDKSLHVTGNGKYIFAPVVRVQSRSNVTATVDATSTLKISGGKPDTDITVGMNENGEIKAGFTLDGKAKLDIVGSAIIIFADDEIDAGIEVTAKEAVDIAVNKGSLDVVLSTRLTQYNGAKAWLVSGTKGLLLASVYVDATTGAVVQAQ